MTLYPRGLVVDASVVVASLIDGGAQGRWADAMLAHGQLLAPHMLPAEVGNVLRRTTRHGAVEQGVAAQAWADLEDLGIALYGFLPLRARVWDLRHNLSSYDAWYVALAEGLDAPLVTLDRRLSRAPGIGCEVLVPAPG